MKNNLILMYIMYLFIVYLLCIIDTTVLIYYMFWINNIFINPLLWLWLKILFYNKTILLLLLFYYYIAKFTIKESGYKYFYFFNIDIRKWRSIYSSYLWNVTTYHIEIFSIFIFFIVITIPLFLYKKEYIILIISIIIFSFILLRIMKNRIEYIKNKKVNLIDLFFIWFILFIAIKVMNHHNFKDIIMTYMHLDQWVFELLEWKIQTYDKIMEKDYYSETVGLKPLWVGKKINEDSIIEKKIWDNLDRKSSKKLIDELYFKLKIFKKKYNMYIKNIKKIFKIKYNSSKIQLEKIKKENSNKNFKSYNSIIINEYTPKVNTKNENPVVTIEKERERALHQTILFGKIFKFSINNYYDLNLYLNDLTFHKLYYQPFMDNKQVNKQIIDEKKGSIYIHIKEKIIIKEEFKLFNAILKKIEKNEDVLNNYLIKDIDNKKDNFLLHKLLDYIIKSKKDNFLIKKILILFNIDENKKKLYEIKGKMTMQKFLIKTKQDLQFDKKINKLDLL